MLKRDDPNPTVWLEVQGKNPDWKVGDDMRSYYIKGFVEAEVLTVHLNNGMMRVRYKWNGKTETGDVSNLPFFEKYSILEKK